MKEADITINGQPLTEAQSMTVRVALQCFALNITDIPAAVDPDTRIRDLYFHAICQINTLMAKTAE
jgi:hypothetical protein